MLTDLKQANKLAPAPMDIETSLEQQYHKMGMKCSPATRPDCLFLDRVGQPQEKAFLLLPALGAVFLLLFFCLLQLFFPHME